MFQTLIMYVFILSLLLLVVVMILTPAAKDSKCAHMISVRGVFKEERNTILKGVSTFINTYINIFSAFE